MTEIDILYEMIGGIFLVLYGIHISEVNLQKILGSNLEQLIKKAGSNPLKGLGIGTFINSMIHSNGTTAMILIGLISGGFMSLNDAVPVMLGASIGSTFATQLASLQIGSYAFLFLSAGILIHFRAEKKIYKRVGEAIIGFSFLFLGMSFIFSGVTGLAGDELSVKIISALTSSPWQAICAGAILTVIMRSASATSILAVAFGAASIVDLSTALFWILGINLGSSLKLLYLTIRGKNFSGKLSLIHMSFNLLGVLLFTLFFDYFQDLARITSTDEGRQIANAHTLYNIITALIFLPLVPIAVKAAEKISPARPIKRSGLFYLDRKLICTPSVSLQQANRGAIEMAKISSRMIELSRNIFFDGQTDAIADIERLERKIDNMTEKISEYTIQVSQQTLSREDTMKLYSIMHVIADIEHLCDHILATGTVMVKAKTDPDVIFSEKAQNELLAVYGKLRIMQNLVVKSLEEDNARLASEITDHENKIDEIIKKISANNEKRLEEGKSTPEESRYFSEILYNLERIGDHYDNIAYAIIDRFRRRDRK